MKPSVKDGETMQAYDDVMSIFVKAVCINFLYNKSNFCELMVLVFIILYNKINNIY